MKTTHVTWSRPSAGDLRPVAALSVPYVLVAGAALLGGGTFLWIVSEVIRVTATALYGMLWYEGRAWPLLALLAIPPVLVVAG